MIHSIDRQQLVPAPLEQVFEFFSRARNLEELTPPWLRFSVLTPEPITMHPGTLIEYRLRVHRVPMRWVSRIGPRSPAPRPRTKCLRPGSTRSEHDQLRCSRDAP